MADKKADPAAKDEPAVVAQDYSAPLTPVHHVTWALVENGFVTAVKASADFLLHPFGEAADGEGKRVLNVTGVACHPGYLADDRGNVAPNESGREMPLTPMEAAYHDRSTPAAAPIAVTAQALQTSEPHPVAQGEREKGEVDMAGKRVEGTVGSTAVKQSAVSQEEAGART